MDSRLTFKALHIEGTDQTAVNELAAHAAAVLVKHRIPFHYDREVEAHDFYVLNDDHVTVTVQPVIRDVIRSVTRGSDRLLPDPE